MRYTLSGYTTVSLYTEVEADSFEQAIAKAEARGMCGVSHNAFQDSPRSEWMWDPLGDEPVLTSITDDNGETREIVDPADLDHKKARALERVLAVLAKKPIFGEESYARLYQDVREAVVPEFDLRAEPSPEDDVERARR